jgi:hypothetical protein
VRIAGLASGTIAADHRASIHVVLRLQCPRTCVERVDI